MTSQPHLPAFVFHPQQCIRSLPLLVDCKPLLLSPESTQDVIRPGLVSTRARQSERPWSHTNGFLDTNQFVSIDSTIGRPVLIDVPNTRPNSVFFSVGVDKKCTKPGEILDVQSSGSSKIERCCMSPSILADLKGLEAIPAGISQLPFVPYYGTSSNSYYVKPILNLVGDLAHSSESVVHRDGQVTCGGKQQLLVPQFDRLKGSKAKPKNQRSLMPEMTNVVPLKSPQKTRIRSSPTNRKSHKSGKEKVLYRTNCFYSCESLLSIIVDKKRHGKTAFLELKKSGPELNQLLTQFSATIAGTGLALLFSVIYKLGSGRVPFCTSKLLNTGLGFGLVWLSWAVNRLRNTIIHISKSSGKWASKDEEMMKNLDSNVKEIAFRAATLMAVVVLRFA